MPKIPNLFCNKNSESSLGSVWIYRRIYLWNYNRKVKILHNYLQCIKHSIRESSVHNSNKKLNVNALFICIIYQTSQPDRYFPYIKTLASIQQHWKKIKNKIEIKVYSTHSFVIVTKRTNCLLFYYKFSHRVSKKKPTLWWQIS